MALSRGPSFNADLATITGIDENAVSSNLRRLARIGFVKYQSVSPIHGYGWVTYQGAGEMDAAARGVTLEALHRNIIEYFKINSVANAQTLAQALGDYTLHSITTALSQLEAAGILTHAGDYKGGEKLSVVSMLPPGKELLYTFILPSLKACARDSATLQALRQHQERVESDPSIPSRAIDIYVKKSPAQNRLSQEELEEIIIQYVTQNGSFRPNQLEESIGIGADKALGRMIESGKLEKHEAGRRAVFYYLPGTEPPTASETYTTLFDYQQPENIVRGRQTIEQRKKSLESPEFWEGLIQALAQLDRSVTEEVFFRKYNPEEPNWWDN